MKNFNEDFKTKLVEAIENIENSSLIEIVTIIRPRSTSYRDIPLWWGIIFVFFTFTILMFIPYVLGDYTFYATVLFSFFVGLILSWLLPIMQRPFISKERMARSVEIMARAIFQKGGIRNTSARIGTLIYVSVFEKKVFIIPDDGARTSIPHDEWDKMNENFNQVFKANNPAAAIIEQINACQPIFAEYIPPIENDINELADDLDVDL